MRIRLLFIGVVAILLGFAPAPFPRPGKKKDDLQRLEGTWKHVRYEMEGQNWLPVIQHTVWKIEKGRFTTIRTEQPGNKKVILSSYELRLDSTKSPRSFDLINGATRWYGSYRFQGDRLELVFHQTGNRPTQFTSTGAYLAVMERVSR